MSDRSAAPRLFGIAMLLIAGLAIGGSRLLAQEATPAPAPEQASLVPASPVPAGAAEAAPSPAVSPDAGPRVTPPLEAYRPSLPQRDRSEDSNSMAAAGKHTIVVSTLVLVLAVIIIVLLVVD